MFPFCSVISVVPLPKGNLNERAGALISLMNQLNYLTAAETKNELKLLNCKYREK